MSKDDENRLDFRFSVTAGGATDTGQPLTRPTGGPPCPARWPPGHLCDSATHPKPLRPDVV